MPLRPPALDDRSYSDLVQDLLASIPAHTPEWTNQQKGDPGRTLIELFAWLADSILYRANLIPERQRLAFLKLVGVPLQPASAATGIVCVFSDPAVTSAVTLATHASLTGPVNFETLSELDVLPVTGRAYIKAPLSADQQKAALPLLQGLQSLYSLANVPSGYSTTPIFANNTSDPNGVDVFASTIDQCLWIALLASKPANVANIRDTLKGKNGPRTLSIGVAPASPVDDPLAAFGPQATIPVTWQISGNSPSGSPLVYFPLDVDSDTTQGLLTNGTVTLRLPEGVDIGAPANDVRSDARAGMGPKPPRIDDPNIDSLLVAWVRVNVQSALTLNWAGINAVEVDQRTTYTNIIAGVSDGSGNQTFQLPKTQIDPSTFQLEVDMPGFAFQPWQPVDDLAALNGPLQNYVLDPEAGTVSFGNQMQGAIPPNSRRIRAALMRAGGGLAGNVPSGSLTAITAKDVSGKPAPGLTVQQPIDTTGGADSEALDHAEQRIPALFRHQDRAVTASDYKNLVQSMPGGSVARAEVLPLFKPQTRDPNVPGVLSVMVIPPKGNHLPPCPRANRKLLETAYSYLNPRRVIAAEMYLIGTEYVGLGISIAVEVQSGFGQLQVSQQVETALRTYLWPVPPGGPAQQGWPLGRTVRSLELEVIVSQVPGISEINGLLLFQLLPGGTYQQIEVNSGNAELTLENWQLPEVLQVLVTPGADGSGVAPGDLNPETQTDDTVAVPIVPNVC
ncbi:MAG TPA: putative baseplate assembly protein [Terracidiphilus sp.]